jgi:hypothetical protein
VAIHEIDVYGRCTTPYRTHTMLHTPTKTAESAISPGSGWAEGKDASKSPPVACVEKSRETRHNCTVPSLSAVPSRPINHSRPWTHRLRLRLLYLPPVGRTPARTLIIIDCDPEDLGRAAAPIGPPAEPALRRPSPYETLRARP